MQHHPVPGSEAVDAAVERVQSGARELAEVRLLNALRSGAVVLRNADATEADRLLGGQGVDTHSRLGLSPDADSATVSVAIGDALARWQRRAENPLAPAVVADAARVLVRTCEGMAAEVAPSSDGGTA